MTTTTQTQGNPNRFTLSIDNPKDNGSLKVGTILPNKKWAVGDKLEIEGEGKIRTVTFVMGTAGDGTATEKTHLCFKGQGAVPRGQISFRVVTAESALPPPAEADMTDEEMEAATETQGA